MPDPLLFPKVPHQKVPQYCGNKVSNNTLQKILCLITPLIILQWGKLQGWTDYGAMVLVSRWRCLDYHLNALQCCWKFQSQTLLQRFCPNWKENCSLIALLSNLGAQLMDQGFILLDALQAQDLMTPPVTKSLSQGSSEQQKLSLIMGTVIQKTAGVPQWWIFYSGEVLASPSVL